MEAALLIDPCPVRPASGRNTGKRSLGGAGELAAQVCGGALTRIGVVFVREIGQLPGTLVSGLRTILARKPGAHLGWNKPHHATDQNCREALLAEGEYLTLRATEVSGNVWG